MATPAFNRGISDDFVYALNIEYEKGGWWRNLVDDDETFVAIRDGYLNVYYCGSSLLKLDYTSSGFQPYTDSAFLSHHDIFDDLADVKGLKNAVNSHTESSPKGQAEKSGVHHIIHNNLMVLDIEVAFGNYERRQADLAALHKVNGSIEVSFYEAKLFSNSYLRTNKNGKLKVLNQVDCYSGLFRKYPSKVMESYRRVSANFANLKGIADRLPERHKLLERIADGSAELRINPNVWLIVFGFDADQKADQNWQKHEKKLFDELGDRLIMEGNPKNLKLIA